MEEQKKGSSKSQGRCPVHDRQVKGIGRLRQHLRTLWRCKFLVRNHPVGKAEQVIVRNLHPFGFPVVPEVKMM